MPKSAVVVPNLNGINSLKKCIDSLLGQSLTAQVIVVENGSTDGSAEFLQSAYPQIVLLRQKINLGFAGGVNVGIRYAIDKGYEYVALFNNDAVADEHWLKYLVESFADEAVGISTCSFRSIDGVYFDSTGDMISNWGLAFPRGRGEKVSHMYDQATDIFAASGGASLYRVSMLQEIGLFDEDFFAYYEDVDISFRAQLAGWKVKFVPNAIAYHDAGTTSRRIKGFTTYQAMKNQPLVLYKNLPSRYFFRVWWRFMLARIFFLARAFQRKQLRPALKGDLVATYLLFKKRKERKRIQKARKVSDEYIWSIFVHDLPPNARALRSLRAKYWKLIRKSI